MLYNNIIFFFIHNKQIGHLCNMKYKLSPLIRKTNIFAVICFADISKYAGPSDLTGKNQAGPTMFSAYRSESPVKICSLLRSGNNFIFVGPSCLQ